MGVRLSAGIEQIAAKHPEVVECSRGLGLMLGMKLKEGSALEGREGKPMPALQVVNALHSVGVLTVPSGEHIVRLLPALNLSADEADECIDKMDQALSLALK